MGSCVGLRGMRIQNIVNELNGEKIDVVEWNSEVRNFIANALSPARPSDTLLVEDGDVRTAIVVVPDRQLFPGHRQGRAEHAAGRQVDRLAHRHQERNRGRTEGLSELKRQQLQAMKQRSLEAKAAALPPSDDLLSRAEWLLREKDKTAVTLEQAARMLADAEAATSQEEIKVIPALPSVETEPDAETVLLEAVETAKVADGAVEGVDEEPVAEVVPTGDGSVDFEEIPEYVLEDVAEEEGEAGEAGDKKPAKKSKKTEKKRELVFDESLRPGHRPQETQAGPRRWLGRIHGLLMAKAKGPRPKHVPIRTCIACRQEAGKRGTSCGWCARRAGRCRLTPPASWPVAALISAAHALAGSRRSKGSDLAAL